MNKNTRRVEPNRVTSATIPIPANCATVPLTGEQGCEDVCGSNHQSADAGIEAIRALAHSKWEAAGCPAGDGFDFWLEAERESMAESSEPCSTQA